MELPAGTYTVTVANNGYGGSTELTIESGRTETLDLNTLKGAGPKFGNILFAVDVEDALIQDVERLLIRKRRFQPVWSAQSYGHGARVRYL